jgi:hypothetical protein
MKQNLQIYTFNCIGNAVYDRCVTAKFKLKVPKGLFVGTSLYFVVIRCDCGLYEFTQKSPIRLALTIISPYKINIV